ncbi:glutathione S-transferase family protein [Dyella silvatica]|uniref:glutathione S-transferase family protein n=1 Tax=Dyella silvatica TaxID=2992128 RepID=UPI0022548CD4|nr:glutathione S-transferase family protein [Dyella silvatica]
MKLFYQTHSPYARKVLVAAHEMGIDHRLEVIHQETSPTRCNEEVFAFNPLGKVPVLICDDGLELFDSNVICEYLDGMHQGQKLIPDEPTARFHALRTQALAQGIADAGIAVRWETERRPASKRWRPMQVGQMQKIISACDFLEHLVDADNPPGATPHIGDIALATTLSWIEFRSVYDFSAARPRLSSWYERMCLRPSMLATPLSGDTRD